MLNKAVASTEPTSQLRSTKTRTERSGNERHDVTKRNCSGEIVVMDLKIKHLTKLCVYGDVELYKVKCVNHVAKRLGTALRRLAGRGFSRLAKTTMGKLEEFYYLAVRGNTGNINKM